MIRHGSIIHLSGLSLSHNCCRQDIHRGDRIYRDVRRARSDLDRIARELRWLKEILETLADASKSHSEAYPDTEKRQLTEIITNYTEAVLEIDQMLENDGTRLSKAARWATIGKDDIAKLRSNLRGHNDALLAALGVVIPCYSLRC